jgi:hypothetical protein
MSLSERHMGWTTLTCLGLNVWLWATPVAAQPSQEQQSAIRSSCRSDYMSNCSSVKPGGIEALQCLQRNVAKLSPGCQSAVNAVSPPPASAQQTATAPAAAPPVQPPAAARPAATALPAPAAAAQPSAPAPAPQPPVRAATAPAATAAPPAASRPTPQQQAAIRQSCQSDFMSRCSGVQPGGADALRCLQRNSAQLSPNCRSAVAALGGPAPAAVATAAPTAAPTLASAPTPEQQNAIKSTCRRDFMTNCRNVTPGGPEAFACLQRNAARLSPDCKTSLAAVADGTPPPVATAAPAAAAPAARPGPVGPLRRAIRERMMNQ